MTTPTTSAELRAYQSAVWEALHDFAKATGCPLGDDVLYWFTRFRFTRPSELVARLQSEESTG